MNEMSNVNSVDYITLIKEICQYPDNPIQKIMNDKLMYYIKKNESGGFKVLAAVTLRTENIDIDTEEYKIYSAGKLPMKRLKHMAARRTAEVCALCADYAIRIMENSNNEK